MLSSSGSAYLLVHDIEWYYSGPTLSSVHLINLWKYISFCVKSPYPIIRPWWNYFCFMHPTNFQKYPFSTHPFKLYCMCEKWYYSGPTLSSVHLINLQKYISFCVKSPYLIIRPWWNYFCFMHPTNFQKYPFSTHPFKLYCMCEKCLFMQIFQVIVF